MSKRLDQLLKNIKVESEKLDRIQVEVYFNQARNAFDEADYNASSSLLDKILTRSDLSEEELLEANFLSGKVNYELGNYESAISFFELVSNPEIGEMYEESQKYITKIRIKQAVEIKRERDALREKLSNMKRYVRNTFLSLISIGTLVLGGFGISQFDCNGQEEQLSEEEDSKYNNNAKYCGNTIADTTLENALQVSQRINAYSSASLSSGHVRNIATGLSTSLNEELQEARRSSAIMLASTLGVAIAWEAPQLCERINEYSREGLEEPIFIPSNEQTLENNLEIVEEEEPEIRGVSRVRETRRSRRETSEGVEEQLMETNQRDDERGYRLLSNFEIHGMSDEQIQRSSSCSVFINGRLYGLGSRTPPAFIFRNQDSNTLFTYHFDWRIIGVNSSNINELENFGLYVVRDGNLTTNSGDIIRGLTTEGIPDGENIYIIKDFNYSRLRVYTTSTRSPDNTDFYSIFFEGRYYGATSRGIRITGRDTRDIQNGQRLCFQNGDLYLRLED